ncbi:MAG: M20/M25/M40 family metallo-hydrolase, partial [Lentisphaeraceae bacterium]|nr:M20/M25/M40 family metallo-hydrolase [Lentisphaeraceae bacterium]
AMPHLSHAPIVCASQLVTALQNIHSRRMAPLEQAVLSITQIHAGDAYNVIPDEVVLRASVRSFKEKVRDDFIREIEQIAAGICAAHHCTYEFTFHLGYPPTVNEQQATAIAAEAACITVGQSAVDMDSAPSMASEDFSFMLKEKPGCYLFLGNGPGEGGCMLHNPHYDFNDNILSIGASYWVNLVNLELK